MGKMQGIIATPLTNPATNTENKEPGFLKLGVKLKNGIVNIPNNDNPKKIKNIARIP